MQRILVIGIVSLFAGAALAGCTGGDTGTTPTSPTTGGGGTSRQTNVQASTLSPKVGEEVTFEATGAQASDTVSWNFGDGATGTGKTARHAYAVPGQFIVTLDIKVGETVSTNDAALTYVSVTPTPVELPDVTKDTPPAAFAAASSQVIQKGQTVRFSANGSGAWVANPDHDPENPVQGPGSHNEPFLLEQDNTTFAWDFGDGQKGTGDTVSHTFATEGTYAVKMTATANTNQKTADYIITVRVLPTAPPASGVRNPKTFVTASIGEPESLDPGYDYETSGGQVIAQVYETLVTYQRDSPTALRGLVAEDLPTKSADGMQYTFKIRKGIKFHDGTDLTAEDVKFSIDRLILMNDPDGPSWIYVPIKGAETYHGADGTAADRKAYLDAKGVEIVDAYTVRINLDFPDPAFLSRMAFTAVAIMSKDYVCKNSPADFVDCLPPPGKTRHPHMDTHEAGSGPFLLDSWIPGQAVILKRFDGYWGTKPALEKVIIQKVPDINTRLLMLFSGQADEVYVGVDHDVDVIGKPGVRIVENPSWTVSFIGLNQEFCFGEDHKDFQKCMTTHGADAPKGADGKADVYFFKDKNMRQAWLHAFDYDTYHDDIVKKHGRMLNGPLPKGIFGYDESIPAMKQDLTKAKEFLAKTNHSDGFTVTIFYNSDNTVREKTANLLAQNLESLAPGKIHASAKGLDWSTAFLPKQRAGGLPVFYLGWAPDYAFPDNYVHTFAHSKLGVYSKRISYANPALDAKLDALLRETDENKLKTGYSDAVKTLNEDAAFMWLGQAANFHVERDYVRGYYYNPMQSGGPNTGDYSVISKG